METIVGKSLYGKRNKSVAGFVLNIVIGVFTLVLVAEIIFGYFYVGIYVVHESMRPTLNGAQTLSQRGGDYIYVNKYAEPDYGDIVIVRRGENDNIVKRVIAFGGDTVKLDGGKVWVNGEEINEYYIDPAYNDPDILKNNYANVVNKEKEHVVAENCMYLLGDNRNASSDSRENGDYPVSSLVGVVPDWSLNTKGFSTSFYNFFHFTLRGK